MDHLIKIELFGSPFTFKAESNVPEAKEVAKHFANEVARIEKQLSEKMPSIDKRAILILTALNITNEYFEYQKQYRKLLEYFSNRSESILNRLNSKLNNSKI